MAKRKHSPFIVCDFKIKSMSEDSEENGFYIVEGYASVYGNIDSYRDIVMPGAFAKDLIENGNTRPILWQHRSEKPIGIGEFSEDSNGLKCTIKMPKESDFVSSEVMPMIKCGAVKGMSIGYFVINDSYDRDSNVNRLEELKLRENSIVTFPANDQAQIIAAKQYLGIEETEREFKSYPIAKTTETWEDSEILNHIKENTKVDKTANKYFDECFLIKGETINDYKLPFIKFIDGKKQIVPIAIQKACASIISDQIKSDDIVKDFINETYQRLGQEFPFQDDKLFIDSSTLKAMNKKGIVTILSNKNIMFSTNAKEFIANSLCCSELNGDVINNSDDDFLAELKAHNEFIKKEILNG